MITEVRVNNVFAFNQPAIFSMSADMRNKRLASNVHEAGDFNVVKSACIYGPNNTGKTCLVRCISVIRCVLLNQPHGIMNNIFTGDTVSELGVSFLYEDRLFSYDFKYDCREQAFIYESFSEIKKDSHGNEKEIIWLKRDSINQKYECLGKELIPMMSVMAKNNIFIYLIDSSRFMEIGEMKRILVGFANRVDILNMNNIPMDHTIELMKNRNQMQERIVEFIRNADLYLDDFEYADEDQIAFESGNGSANPDEKVLGIPEQLIDRIRLVSTYRGKHVPSLLFDSTGTKKITALASYVIEALEKGRVLVIDELDSSLHFSLTRAIAALFNNELNNNAQLIFTVHDVSLLDCKRLFRKEQIWFVNKDDDGVSLYSLAEFTARDGVRDTSDIIEKYRKGAFAALPEPELINTLLNIKEYAENNPTDEKQTAENKI